MLVRDVMSEPPVTVTHEATIHEAIGAMLEHKVGSVIVEVDTNAAGILTRSDALRGSYHAGGNLRELSVRRAMSADLVTTKPTRTVRSALRTMELNEIKKLPVVESLEAVGIITMTDIAQQLPQQVREAKQNLERQDGWSG